MNNKTKINLIVPVYNAENYLKKCLNSILEQNFKDYQVILVNDGSRDKSAEIIDKYMTKYPDLFILINKENGGLSSARNAALKVANAEYILFLDSDDYIDKNYLKNLYERAVENNSDMVISGQNKVDESGRVLDHITYPVKKYPNTILRKLNIAGKIYKLSFIKKYNLKFALNKTYEDNPFNLQALFLAKNLQILDYAGYNQIVHKGSITTSKIVENKIPYEAIDEALANLFTHKIDINNIELLEFTVLSFFTYFIFQANKANAYMDVEDRKSDTRIVENFSNYARDILYKYFPNFTKNKYLKLRKNKELQIKQRLGVKVYVFLLQRNFVNHFIKIFYSI